MMVSGCSMPTFWRSARSRTGNARSGTAAALTTTTTSVSKRRTCAWPAACSARSHGSSLAIRARTRCRSTRRGTSCARGRLNIANHNSGTERYLEIHRTAHRLGLRSNITMLYGHIETAEERVDHMLRARALQDETGGFHAFIPLAFHPDNNQMRKLPAPSAIDSLRVHAVSRLMCDNIAHVKAVWIATGGEVAQTALWFGVDDLD